jgi:hypothetical protein
LKVLEEDDETEKYLIEIDSTSKKLLIPNSMLQGLLDENANDTRMNTTDVASPEIAPTVQKEIPSSPSAATSPRLRPSRRKTFHP